MQGMPPQWQTLLRPAPRSRPLRHPQTEVEGLTSIVRLLQGRVDALYARLITPGSVIAEAASITPGPVIAEATSEYMTISKAKFAEMRKEICELQAKLQERHPIPPKQ